MTKTIYSKRSANQRPATEADRRFALLVALMAPDDRFGNHRSIDGDGHEGEGWSPEHGELRFQEDGKTRGEAPASGATSCACRRSVWSPPTTRWPGTDGACRSRPIPPGPISCGPRCACTTIPTARSPSSMGRGSWSDGDRTTRRIPRPCAPRLEPLWRRRAGLWTAGTRLRLAPPRPQQKQKQKRSIYVLHKPDIFRSSLQTDKLALARSG